MRRRTCLGCRVLAGATKLRCVKRGTRALARHHHAAAALHLKLRRTTTVQVRHTPGILAVTGSSGSPHTHPHVVAVHQAHIVEVLVAVTGATDGEFHQRHRRSTSPGALQSTGAVPGDAFSIACTVEFATGPAPEAPGPARRCHQLNRRTGGQGKPTVA